MTGPEIPETPDEAVRGKRQRQDAERRALADAILDAVEARGPSKTACPSEIARAIAGQDEKAWRLLMKPIRAEAVALAHAGRVEIRRKGKTVSPDDFKGIYRIGAVSGGAGSA